jgi:hypothetical protein
LVSSAASGWSGHNRSDYERRQGLQEHAAVEPLANE